MMKVRASVSFLASLLFAVANGQQSKEYTLRWELKPPVEAVDGKEINAAGRDGIVRQGSPAIPNVFPEAFIDRDRGGMPFFQESFPLPGGSVDLSAALTNAVYVSVSDAERSTWTGWEELTAEPVLDQRLSWYRKQPYAIVSFYPFRRNPSTGQFEKLLSFRLDIGALRGAGGGGRPKSYPATSRLLRVIGTASP